jgi:hypothetical protein
VGMNMPWVESLELWFEAEDPSYGYEPAIFVDSYQLSFAVRLH